MLNKLNELRAQKEEGFTLIELLVVIVIIGVLAAIALPIFLNQQKAAIAASLKSDVHNNVTLVNTLLVKDPTNTALRTAIPSANRVRTTQSNLITYADTYNPSTLAYSGEGAWNQYIVIGWNTDLGSVATTGKSGSSAYFYDSTTGKYQGVGEGF